MIVYDICDNLTVVDQWELERSYYWICCDQKEVHKLGVIFSAETIEECQNFRQYPRIDYYKNYSFMVFNALDNEDLEIIPREIDIYLGKSFIVTVYKNEVKLISNLMEDIEKDKNCFILKKNCKPYIILYYILDRLIINNYNIIADLETEADRIELDILKSPKSKHINKLVSLRRESYKLRKLLNPLRYIGDALLLNENNVIEHDQMYLFRNLNDKIEKLLASMESLAQDLAMVREAYEAEIGIRTNELMKAFTIITAVFLPLQLITAIFGMSFEHIPFKNDRFAFEGLIGTMAFLVVILMAIFKGKKIL
ncbi:magnesium transporter CorA family protein [Clostridium folliculivorans]|uniref:Dihydroorotate dehydrogenase n=1 Tax=Clostridium folliculivorans TaxID=2886038 RepID=A0A9W5Y2U3_9CLOT|nr:magnesium transporter CorA family protein [Clostridium folliculivorans]GKU25573.1 dihydroorotate dehydrogenase [Clostridium folliculivorans]GKU28595.1 dihydroorotate dehydrogenase [Clostridium folliculivorans]